MAKLQTYTDPDTRVIRAADVTTDDDRFLLTPLGILRLGDIGQGKFTQLLTAKSSFHECFFFTGALKDGALYVNIPTSESSSRTVILPDDQELFLKAPGGKR